MNFNIGMYGGAGNALFVTENKELVAMIEEVEVGKYKKKTKSNISKSKSKSKHKHISRQCLLVDKNRPYLATYCSICGKVQNWQVPVSHGEIVGGKKCARQLTSEEVFEKYRELERVKVEDIFIKYIPVRDVSLSQLE